MKLTEVKKKKLTSLSICVMRAAVPIPGLADSSVLHSAVAVGGSVVGVVRPL